MIIGMIALLSALMLGGGGHVSILQMLEAMSPLVAEHVGDPARAEAAEDVLSRMRTEITAAVEELSVYREEIVAQGLDHAGSGPELEQAFAGIRAVRAKAERGLVEGQLELREHITPTEWAAIYAELDAMRR